jgi:hypothetical protein
LNSENFISELGGAQQIEQRKFSQMKRIITFEANFDRPIDLQAVQEAGANWNGQTIELTFNISVAGRLETFLAPIALTQAQLFLARLQEALNHATET